MSDAIGSTGEMGLGFRQPVHLYPCPSRPCEYSTSELYFFPFPGGFDFQHLNRSVFTNVHA
jgi:hypothetical protein